MAICPYCESRIDDNAKFCNFCGAKMESVPVPDRADPLPQFSDPVPQDVGAVPEVPEIPDIPAAAAGPDAPTVVLKQDADPAPGAPAAAPQDPQQAYAPFRPDYTQQPVQPGNTQPVYPQPGYSQPAFTPPVQPAYTQPGYTQTSTQPLYSQPTGTGQPKKSKKWMIPLIIVAALALIGIAVLVFGGSGSSADSPYLGTYNATTISMYGLEMNIDDVYDGGFSIELRPNGRCNVQAGDSKGSGTWEITDGKLTIKDSTDSIEGKIEGSVMTIENMLDMGMDITLVKEE